MINLENENIARPLAVPAPEWCQNLFWVIRIYWIWFLVLI